jgi:hypothetical protein
MTCGGPGKSPHPGPRERVLAEALGELDTYDGITGYLLGPGGMRPAALAALRTALLSRNPATAGQR